MSRELDRWVAENIMGCKKIMIQVVEEVDRTTNEVTIGTKFDYPSYSTDIAAAWEVVEKLDVFEFRVEKVESGVWRAMIWCSDGNILEEIASSTPLAICLAAKKAIEDTITEELGNENVQNV